MERGDYQFKAGECALLVDSDGCTSRPYSISSGPDELELAFVIRYMRGGALSEYLASRQPGDEVEVGPPFGLFYPGQAGPSVFIATGTGISPFLSYLKQPGAPPPTKILYGVRRLEEGLELGLLQRYPLLLAVSGEAPVWGVHGRLTQFLAEIPLADGLAKEPLNYYLCGQGPMIREVSAWLRAQAVEPRRIFTEVFFE